MIGTTILHYQIIRELGKGGMGEVYLATDTSLGRQVALKFLPAASSDDVEARARLLLEAQHSSLLNHPNVVTIHAIEHVDGRDFIVMEYIEGQTLKDAMKAGLMPLEQIVKVATATCDGLSAAHEAGIVHRDIKPDNIFLTPRGHVKIADFGLARSETAASHLTRTGMPVGTASYMSPEQARGEKDVDSRSDIFSLGCVLYEMATGRRPFEGDHLTAVLYALLSEDPPKPTTIRADLPEGLDIVVATALAKDRDSRYQSAQELSQALRNATGWQHSASSFVGTGSFIHRPAKKSFSTRMKLGIAVLAVAIVTISAVGYDTFKGYFDFVKTASGPIRKKMAVLPFTNLGTADQEYFADGLTEEVITKLSSVSELSVISRTSVMGYKKTSKNVRQIGDELGVEYLMEGSVRWAPSAQGDRLKVTARLIAADEGTSLWDETYDTLMSDVFAIQNDIGTRVTGAMQITLIESERLNLVRGGTKNINALLAFYKGNAHFHSVKLADEMAAAINAYRSAVTFDSNYAQAWARLSRAHGKMVHWGFGKVQDHAAAAKDALEHARRLEPAAPETYLAGGYYSYRVARDYARAIEQFGQLESSGIKSSELYEAYEALAYVLRRQGEFESALARLQAALTQDPDLAVKDAAPRFAVRAWEIGNTYLRLRRWNEAEPYLRRAVDLNPLDVEPYLRLARLQIYAYGNPDSAKAILDAAPNAIPTDALAEERVFVDILRRDPVSAHNQLRIVNDDIAYYNLQRAWIADLSGDDALRSESYDRARIELENLAQAYPTDSDIRRYLGIAYAGLGRRDDALREGRKALELQSIASDAFFRGPKNIEGMAQIHTLLGNPDEAIDMLYSLLQLPAGLVTAEYLRIAPEYDPLSGNPRFEQLVSSGRPTAWRPAPLESYSLLRSGSIAQTVFAP